MCASKLQEQGKRRICFMKTGHDKNRVVRTIVMCGSCRKNCCDKHRTHLCMRCWDDFRKILVNSEHTDTHDKNDSKISNNVKTRTRKSRSRVQNSIFLRITKTRGLKTRAENFRAGSPGPLPSPGADPSLGLDY